MKRPTYCPFQNISYMIRRAYREAPVILPVAAGMIVAGTAINILELVTAPAILDAVERNVPIAALLRMIAALTAAMLLACSGRAYLWENALFGQVHLRINISSQLHSKFCTTSYAHLLDTAYIERSNKAQLATQGNTDATEAIWDTLVELCTNAISFSVYLLLLGSANPVILAITLVAAVFSYSAGKRIRLWRYQHQDEEAAYRQRLSYIAKRARSRELAKDIRIFGLKAWLQARWGQSLALYHDFCKKAEKRHLLADTVDILATLLRNGAAYAYLLRMTLLGELNAPEFVLLFSAVTGLGSWTTGLLRNLETLNKQSSDISFVREYLDTPEPFPFDEGEPLAVKPNHRYTMELRDVSFRYPNAESEVLSHVNLKIAAGEKIALVGLNGAGKTTMLRLLCGFLDPTGGTVLLDGEDIRRYNRRDYYRLIAAVFQQSSVLAGTIAENVAQATDGIDAARVRRCLEQAGLSNKVRSLPGGEETLLNRNVYENAVEFSGGEMQRLLLARALYKNAPILVLDEPTAALDAITESALYRQYNEMTRGCTAIYISHRLASTRFCDRIILVEGGKIAEEGTHEALMAQGGAYAALFAVQSKYYQEEVRQNEAD